MKKLLLLAAVILAGVALAPTGAEAGPHKKKYGHKHSAHHKKPSYPVHRNKVYRSPVHNHVKRVHTHSYRVAPVPRHIYSYPRPVYRSSYSYRSYPRVGYVAVPGFSFHFGGFGGYCH